MIFLKVNEFAQKLLSDLLSLVFYHYLDFFVFKDGLRVVHLVVGWTLVPDGFEVLNDYVEAHVHVRSINISGVNRFHFELPLVDVDDFVSKR